MDAVASGGRIGAHAEITWTPLPAEGVGIKRAPLLVGEVGIERTPGALPRPTCSQHSVSTQPYRLDSVRAGRNTVPNTGVAICAATPATR